VKAVPVIAIDGPAGSGKGTVAQRVAERLGYRYLDSGALYRLVAVAAMRRGVPFATETDVIPLADALDCEFSGGRVRLDGEDVTDEIRTEAASAGASRVAAIPAVRAALLERQRRFRQAPGLVADGRDMGSVVFPDAALKVFLTASAEARAARRHKQLMEKGISVSIDTLLRDLRERDARDAERAVAPLRATPDAKLLDTTSLTVDEAVERVAGWARSSVGSAA
jgi:3-phosphoshikimate 1-carboxyvinyltransferase